MVKEVKQEQITSTQWAQTLSTAVKSIKEGSLSYIGHKFTTGEVRGKKISLTSILQKSNEMIAQAKNEFIGNKINLHEFKEVTKNIESQTRELINHKRDATARARQGWIIASALTSIFGIGIIMGIITVIKQYRDSQKFAKLSNQSDQLSFKATAGVTDSKTIIQAQMNDANNFIKDLKNTCSKEDLKNELESQLKINMQSINLKTGNVNQFEKDMKRMGISFLRNDKNINDKTPIPLKQIEEKMLTSEEIISQAARAIDEICAQEKDNKWKNIIQAVSTQDTPITVFGKMQSLFGIKSVDEFGYPLQLKYASPPINLEIIRDERTNEIKQINVTTQGYMDLFDPEDGTKLVSDAFSAEMSFSIEMDEEGNPKIKYDEENILEDNFHVNWEASPLLLQNSKITNYKKQVPETIKNLNAKEFSDLALNSLNGCYEDGLNDYYRSDTLNRREHIELKGKQVPLLDQFKADITRSITFKRFDEALKIKDEVPNPKKIDEQENTEEEKIQLGLASLNELITNDLDLPWLPILELTSNQTQLNTIAMKAVGDLNSAAALNMWKEGKNTFRFLAEIKGVDYPPIELHIIRENGLIKKVDVSVDVTIELKKMNTALPREDAYTILNEAIKAKLNYTVELGAETITNRNVRTGKETIMEGNKLIQRDIFEKDVKMEAHKRPIISNFHLKYESYTPTL